MLSEYIDAGHCIQIHQAMDIYICIKIFVSGALNSDKTKNQKNKNVKKAE